MDVAVGLSARIPRQKRLSKWHYRVVSEDLYQVELGEYHTYGIQFEAPDCADIIHDVSVCKKTTEYIVGLLNSRQVSHIHLYDVVTDMLP